MILLIMKAGMLIAHCVFMRIARRISVPLYVCVCLARYVCVCVTVLVLLPLLVLVKVST